MGHQEHFSTVASNPSEFDRIYVNSLNAFPDPVGDTITLANNINYIISRSFSLGAFRFLIPTGGQIELNGTSELLEPLVSTLSTGALFSGDVQRLVIREVDFINVNPANAAAFWGIATIVTPSPTVIFRRSFVTGFSTIGTLEGVFYIANNVVYANCGGGLNLTNPNNRRAGILIKDQQHAAQVGTHVSIFDAQGFLSIQNLSGDPSAGDSLLHLDTNLMLPSPGAVAGGGTGLITNCGFHDVNGGTFLTATSVDQTDNRFIFRDNYRTIDSNTIGSLGFKENATVTTISTVNTYTDIVGAFLDIELERFTRSGGELISDNLIPFKAIAHVSITAKRSIPASSARTIRIAVFVDSGLGFVEQADSASMSMVGSIRNLSFQVPINLLLETDRIKVQIKNEDTIDDVVVVDYNLTVAIA